MPRVSGNVIAQGCSQLSTRILFLWSMFLFAVLLRWVLPGTRLRTPRRSLYGTDLIVIVIFVG